MFYAVFVLIPQISMSLGHGITLLKNCQLRLYSTHKLMNTETFFVRTSCVSGQLIKN